MGERVRHVSQPGLGRRRGPRQGWLPHARPVEFARRVRIRARNRRRCSWGPPRTEAIGGAAGRLRRHGGQSAPGGDEVKLGQPVTGGVGDLGAFVQTGPHPISRSSPEEEPGDQRCPPYFAMSTKAPRASGWWMPRAQRSFGERVQSQWMGVRRPEGRRRRQQSRSRLPARRARTYASAGSAAFAACTMCRPGSVRRSATRARQQDGPGTGQPSQPARSGPALADRTVRVLVASISSSTVVARRMTHETGRWSAVLRRDAAPAAPPPRVRSRRSAGHGRLGVAQRTPRPR